jgi:hypothetical protein
MPFPHSRAREVEELEQGDRRSLRSPGIIHPGSHADRELFGELGAEGRREQEPGQEPMKGDQ